METRSVLRWTIEETPASATAPRQVWMRAVWDELPVAWAGPSEAGWDTLDRNPAGSHSRRSR
jgi:hypothetical protein